MTKRRAAAAKGKKGEEGARSRVVLPDVPRLPAVSTASPRWDVRRGRRHHWRFLKDKDHKAPRPSEIVDTPDHSVEHRPVGRMVRRLDEQSRRTAARNQVAHAISVHAVRERVRTTTRAVDEPQHRRRAGGAGGMTCTVDFNQPPVTLCGRRCRLCAPETSARAWREETHRVDENRYVRASKRFSFTAGFVESLPQGKINPFGKTTTLPDAVVRSNCAPARPDQACERLSRKPITAGLDRGGPRTPCLRTNRGLPSPEGKGERALPGARRRHKHLFGSWRIGSNKERTSGRPGGARGAPCREKLVVASAVPRPSARVKGKR